MYWHCLTRGNTLQVDQALTSFIAKLKLQQSSVSISLQLQPPSPQGSATKAIEPKPQPIFVPAKQNKAAESCAVPSAPQSQFPKASYRVCCLVNTSNSQHTSDSQLIKFGWEEKSVMPPLENLKTVSLVRSVIASAPWQNAALHTKKNGLIAKLNSLSFEVICTMQQRLLAAVEMLKTRCRRLGLRHRRRKHLQVHHFCHPRYASPLCLMYHLLSSPCNRLRILGCMGMTHMLVCNLTPS